MTYKVLAVVKEAEDWERAMSCNGCRRSRGVDASAPEVTTVVEIGTRGPGLGSGSEFRFCEACMSTVRAAFARPEDDPRVGHEPVIVGGY